MGVAPKIGFDVALKQFIKISYWEIFINHLLARVSTYYVAYNNIFYTLFDIDLQLKSLINIWKLFFERIDKLIPNIFFIAKDTDNIAKINYQLLWIDNSMTESGASYGLLGAVSYIPFFPFNIIIITLYTLFCCRLINRYFPKSSKNYNLILLYFIYYIIFDPLTANIYSLFQIDGLIGFFIILTFISFLDKKST